MLTACGMTDDPREDEKRQNYPEIPDPHFKSYLLETYDLNRDGKFSYYEAERILTIDCSGRGIATLYGIEHFVQLRELRCSDNHIESLDVTHNHDLELLDCSRNALYQLDIERLRELRELYCSENSLPHLEFANTPALHTINCASNQLELLDVTNCARTMKLLDARFNPLQTIYYSQYQSFEQIQPGSGELVAR